jgi:Acetyltransferase (GNAT) family
MAVAKAVGALPDHGLTVMTEAEFASMRVQEGATVVQRDGRYWEAPFPGFYQPIHWLARFRAAAARRPALFCWGYRAALTDADARVANGSVPVHLLTNLEHFPERVLNRNRLRDLRKCRRQVELRRVRDPSLLVEQGYGIFMSAQLRVPFGRVVTQEAYQRRIGRRASNPLRVFVAGLVDGRLAGYLESYAVDGVLYLHELYIATEFLRTGIGTGLYVETIEIGARAGTIDEVCSGIHTPERPGITALKDSLGFTVVQVPARVAMPAPIGAYIKARHPLTYYRLVGVKPAAVAEAHD